MSTVPDLVRMRPTWADIDLDAFASNVEAFASSLPAGARLVPVLKADAYGHGAVELARRCTAERVAMIAVALLEEALELRREGVTLPLLVLGPLTPEQIPLALDHHLTPGVVGPEELEAICRVARERDVVIHLKLDTGMGRMGVLESEVSRAVEMIRSAPRLRVEGIYTHFASADETDDPLTEQQIAAYDRMVSALREAGVDAPKHHFANTAATTRGLVRPGDFARVGIGLYGPRRTQVGGSTIEPVMRWRTEIARLKTLPPGYAVGYGATFRTSRETRVATLPVGYADGFNRLQSNNAEVLVRGRRAPLIGRVSMDLVTIDVSGIDGIAAGAEVVLLGKQGSESIDAEEMAARIGTISYEVFCNVSARVPRVYRGDGRASVRSRFDR